MAVYVDKPLHKYRRMVMCHMIADTLEELHSMADKIGIKRKWFQANASFPHYDICRSKRSLAISNGAIILDWRKLALKIKELRGKGDYE